MSIQIIRSARAGRPVTWYIYAFRGGPLIRKVTSPRKPTLTSADHAAVAAALADDRAIDPLIFRSVIRSCIPVDPAKDATDASEEWKALSANTKRVWRPHVDLIEARWGKFPVSVWDDPRMIEKVVRWRDERAATPRTADIGVQVLDFILMHARLKGRVRINVARDVPRLYRDADRADVIWTAEDIAAFEAKAIELKRPQMIDGLRLAMVTGMRREDLVTLTWAQIGQFAIVKKALKSSRGKRRRAIIPQTPQLEAVLADLRGRARKPGVDTVLVNSKGTPWTANSFGGSFSRLKQLAGIEHVDEEGNRSEKHLHDVRGTFCTMLLTEWELTDDEAADIMGWAPTRVSRIRKVYVDHLRVVVALGARLAAKHSAKQHSATQKK